MSAAARRKKIQTKTGIDIDEIQPLDSRILVRRIQPVTSSIIIIPDCAKEKSTRGVVLATGLGKVIDYEGGKKIRRPMSVKPGDIVIFGPWDDLEGHLGGDFALVQEDDIRVAYFNRSRKA